MQFFFQWGLTELFGVEKNLAGAATFLYHPIIVYIPPVVFGLLFAWRDGLTPASLRALANAAPAGETHDGSAASSGSRSGSEDKSQDQGDGCSAPVIRGEGVR